MSSNSEQIYLEETQWDFTIDSILRKKTVLFLGPAIYGTKNDEPAQQNFYKQLAKQKPNIILRYNEKEGFFLFRNKSQKVMLNHLLVPFYKEMVSLPIYDQLSALPFHMVLSINPDKALFEKWQSNGTNAAFHFYGNSQKEAKIEKVPTVENPLLYNLFGAIEEPSSLLLSHDQLFEFTKHMFENKLPEKVRTALLQAEFFLFLGFDFDKWYVQLLLKLIESQMDGNNHQMRQSALHQSWKNGSDLATDITRFAALQHMSEDSLMFCKDEFNVQFINEGYETFVDKLYNKIEQKGALRKPNEAVATLTEQLQHDSKKRIIQQKEVEIKALEQLIHEMTTDFNREDRTLERARLEAQIGQKKGDLEKLFNELNHLTHE